MKIGIIGGGYIGENTAIFFAKNGVYSTIIDIDKNKVEQLNKGILPIKDLKSWLTFDAEPLIKKYIKASTNFNVLLNDKDIEAIFIAIPTEKDGEPYFKALEAVINKIYNSPKRNNLIIVESTLMPGVSDEHIKPYLPNFVISPRRDWFEKESGRNLESLARIVGGSNNETTEKALSILSIVCNDLHTCNYKEAELVKAVENSIRHVGAVYAQELAWSYPDLDVRKILKLASSKWNIPYYYPNILGTSGYCIPLSSRYIVKGSKKPGSIAQTVISGDEFTSKFIANRITALNPKSIGILGIAYLADIKVHILSGAMRLLKRLKADEDRWYKNYWKFQGVKVNDPLYTIKELKKITGCETFKVPEDLDKFEIIVLTAGHNYYAQIPADVLIEKTKNARFILDNTGIWEHIKFKCPYILPGRKGWIDKIR